MDGKVGVARRRSGTLLATWALLILCLLATAGAARAAAGDVYVADPFSQPGFVPAIVKINAAGAQSIVATGDKLSTGMSGLALQSGGVLQLANGGPALSASIVRVDIASGVQTFTSQNGLIAEPKGIVLARSGVEAYVADQTVAQILVVTWPRAPRPWSRQAISWISKRRHDRQGRQSLRVRRRDGSHEVIRVNPANGAQSPVTYGGELTNLQGITSGPNGDLFVADFDAQVVRINPSTGVQQKAAEGGNLVGPQDVAFTPAGDMLVSDAEAFGSGGVIRVNVATGAQSVLAQGGRLQDPRGIAVDPTVAPTTTPDKSVIASFRAKKVQRVLRQKGVIVQATCPQEACVASAAGTISAPAGKRKSSAAKRYKLRSIKRSLAKGKKTRLKLRLRKATARAVKRALRAHKKVRARVKVHGHRRGRQQEVQDASDQGQAVGPD